ncbi:MAG: GNAT family N-acetyltransferase [Planctomycetota bacterium]
MPPESPFHRLELSCPSTPEDRQDIFDLTAKCFSGSHHYYDWLAEAEAYFHPEHYDAEASTIGRIDGRIVTHWGVWGYRMRVGRARLATAGIGAVATAGDLRGKGLMAATALAGLDRIRQAGYDFSVLFGIGDFYHRFGYVAGWPDTVWQVQTARLPEKPASMKLRKCSPLDERIAELYNRSHAGLVASAIRPTCRQLPPRRQGWCWESDGRIVGYVVTGKGGGRFECVEAGGPAELALGALRHLATKAGASTVHFPSLPAGDGTAQWLRTNDGTRTEKFARSGGPMVRTVNLLSCLRKMRPELQARLACSPAHGWQGRFGIGDGVDRVALKIREGKIQVAPAESLGQHGVEAGPAAARLLIGSDQPAQVARDAGLKLQGDAPLLLEALFPARQPMLRRLDSF